MLLLLLLLFCSAPKCTLNKEVLAASGASVAASAWCSRCSLAVENREDFLGPAEISSNMFTARLHVLIMEAYVSITDYGTLQILGVGPAYVGFDLSMSALFWIR